MASSRVLVVDDNHAIADTVAILVRHLGHLCTCAYDGRTALKLVDDFRPDVIFLDLKMPHMDGFAVARALRQAGCQAKIVAITGFGESVFTEVPRAAGFDGVLQKPATAEQIAAIVTANVSEGWWHHREDV
jgi:CheY-like chemotaxis protein